MITFLASLLGFAGSWLPQILKMISDKSDKAHEITLLQMQMDAAKEQSTDRLAEIGAQGDAAQATAIYGTYKTGVTWVDSYNGIVRPTITFALFFEYALMKYLQYTIIGSNAPLFQRLDALWTQDDMGMFAGCIAFYFGSRAMKANGK